MDEETVKRLISDPRGEPDRAEKRVPPTDTSEAFSRSIAQNITNLEDSLAQAEQEQEYWTQRANDVRMTLRAMREAFANLPQNLPTTAPSNAGTRIGY